MPDETDSIGRRFEALFSDQLRENSAGLKQVERQLNTLSADVRVLDNSITNLQNTLKEADKIFGDLKIRERVESLEGTRSTVRGALATLWVVWLISTVVFGWILAVRK